MIADLVGESGPKSTPPVVLCPHSKARRDMLVDLLLSTWSARPASIEKLAPHDLRRTCARLCYLAGIELDQIQFLLGHVSIQTTELYLRWKQKLRVAVNDRLRIEPDAA